MESKFKIKVETEGMEEATEQIEALANAYDGFPAQVTIKNCHHCTFNIHPSQMRIVDDKGGGRMSNAKEFITPAESDPDAEFWENRAAEYSKIIASLVADMCKGINFESMQITETGKIIFERGEDDE